MIVSILTICRDVAACLLLGVGTKACAVVARRRAARIMLVVVVVVLT
jgi:hypothetical protein